MSRGDEKIISGREHYTENGVLKSERGEETIIFYLVGGVFHKKWATKTLLNIYVNFDALLLGGLSVD
jgi:hypothetical protein